jgi:LysR family transcriptional regulator, regulator of abg operon
MKLHQIREVLVVAELGSLRAAARHLRVGQPSITRSIRDIEQELGAALFERSYKGIRLTSIGRSFVVRATRVDQELRRAKEEVDQAKGLSTGEVSIAMSVAGSIALIPFVVSRFRQRYPGGLLKLAESLFQPIEGEINDGQLDFYVGALDVSVVRPALTVEKLFDNNRLIIGRKGHRLTHAKTLEELASAEWVRPSVSPGSTEAEFNEVFTSLGLAAPRIVVHSRSALQSVLTVASSDLLTVGPRQWTEFPPFADRLQAIALGNPLDAVPVCLVRRSAIPLTPMAEYLCDLFRRAAADYETRQTLGSKNRRMSRSA